MDIRPTRLVSPGIDTELMQKAADTSASQIVLDLEDSILPEHKADSRDTLIRSVANYDWTNTHVSVRINAIGTPYSYKDIMETITHAGAYIDSIVVPEAGSASEIESIATLLTEIETTESIADPIGIEPMIEDPTGIRNVYEIATASERNEALIFGNHDYAVQISGAVPVARPNERVSQYAEVLWDVLGISVVQAANVAGINPITSVGDDNFTDLDRLRRESEHARSIGFVGGMAIHPDQLAVLEEAYTPSKADLEWAQKVVREYERAENDGRGVLSIDGQMVLVAHYEIAKKILKFDE